MKEIRMDARVVSAGQPVLVIAEIGVNHDGRVEKALELVEHARSAGADAVKVQVFRATELMHGSSGFAEYQKERCAEGTPAEMLRRYELSGGDMQRVVERVRERGMIPLATPFSLSDVQVVERMNLPAIKIASPDVVNYPLLKRCAGLKRPLLISTGAATIEELDRTAGWLGEWKASFAFLHCVSSYPTPVEEAHLNWIGELAGRFDVPVGYSDHTTELLAGALAVAAGACVVEKHLTYDRGAQGPDHAASADPGEFAEYVRSIRVAEKMRGAGGKRVLSIERDVRTVSRQSVVASRDLPVGHVIGEKDLMVQRPGTEIGAERWEEVVGKVVARPIVRGTMVSLEMLRNER